MTQDTDKSGVKIIGGHGEDPSKVNPGVVRVGGQPAPDNVEVVEQRIKERVEDDR